MLCLRTGPHLDPVSPFAANPRLPNYKSPPSPPTTHASGQVRAEGGRRSEAAPPRARLVQIGTRRPADGTDPALHQVNRSRRSDTATDRRLPACARCSRLRMPPSVCLFVFSDKDRADCCDSVSPPVGIVIRRRGGLCSRLE